MRVGSEIEMAFLNNDRCSHSTATWYTYNYLLIHTECRTDQILQYYDRQALSTGFKKNRLDLNRNVGNNRKNDSHHSIEQRSIRISKTLLGKTLKALY